MASTPYDVAVGGTDFDDVLDQTAIAYWNTSNNRPRSHRPNRTCRDDLERQLRGPKHSFTWDITSRIPQRKPYATIPWPRDHHRLARRYSGRRWCQQYLCKPSWQSGVTGIPADGQRDLPDVSLFAGDGLLSHYYPVCQADQGATCNPSVQWNCRRRRRRYILQRTGFRRHHGDGQPEDGFAPGLANPTLYKLASIQYGNSATHRRATHPIP